MLLLLLLSHWLLLRLLHLPGPQLLWLRLPRRRKPEPQRACGQMLDHGLQVWRLACEGIPPP